MIRPSAEVEVGRLEKDRSKLETLYRQGYEDTLNQMDSLKSYLGIE